MMTWIADLLLTSFISINIYCILNKLNILISILIHQIIKKNLDFFFQNLSLLNYIKPTLIRPCDNPHIFTASIDNHNSQPYKMNKSKPFVISPFSQNTHNNMIIHVIIRSQTAFKTVNYYSRFLYFFLWFCLCVLFCSCLSLTAGWREPRCAWEPGIANYEKHKIHPLAFLRSHGSLWFVVACVLTSVYSIFRLHYKQTIFMELFLCLCMLYNM